MEPQPEWRVCLVSSSGGVLHDVVALRPWWRDCERFWIAVADTDTVVALSGERVVWHPEVSPRAAHRLAASVARSARTLRRERPDVVVSAGTGVAVGVFLAAKMLRIPSIWIETLNMVDRPGLASRLCMRLAGAVLVQRAELLATRPRSVLIGELY